VYTKAHDLMGSDLDVDLPNFHISSRYVETHYWHNLMAVTVRLILLVLVPLRLRKLTERKFKYYDC
jgi:hypothetical protein